MLRFSSALQANLIVRISSNDYLSIVKSITRGWWWLAVGKAACIGCGVQNILENRMSLGDRCQESCIKHRVVIALRTVFRVSLTIRLVVTMLVIGKIGRAEVRWWKEAG